MGVHLQRRRIAVCLKSLGGSAARYIRRRQRYMYYTHGRYFYEKAKASYALRFHALCSLFLQLYNSATTGVSLQSPFLFHFAHARRSRA